MLKFSKVFKKLVFSRKLFFTVKVKLSKITFLNFQKLFYNNICVKKIILLEKLTKSFRKTLNFYTD